MFSSLLSSASPKALLASKLAAALGTYFEVDPSKVQSNLLTHTKIILHDIRLRSQSLPAGILNGVVDEIEFSWKWGGSADNSTSFVRETILTIRGARLYLHVGGSPDADADAISSNSTAVGQASSQDQPSATTKNPSVKASMMDQYIQQIIDHLTLNVTDVELTVKRAGESTDGDDALVLQATCLQLLSLGRDIDAQDETGPPLSQRLSLESLKAFVMSNGTKHPVLDPFGYAASVERIAGRRFLNFEKGLRVTGNLAEGSELQLHADRPQLQVVVPLMRVLLEAESTQKTCLSGSKESEIKRDLQERQDVEASAAVPSTNFSLPIPGLVIELPNEAKINLPSCVFSFNMDGTVCSLFGSHGIRINDDSSFLQLGPGATWLSNFTTSTFTIEINSETSNLDEFADAAQDEADMEIVAGIELDEVQVKRLIKGMMTVTELTRNVVNCGSEAYQNEVEAQTKPWSVAILGKVATLVRGEDNEWIKSSFDSLSLTLGSGGENVLDELNLVGTRFGPTSFGKLVIYIPSVRLSPGSTELQIEAPLQVTCESWTVLEQLRVFFTRFVDVPKGALFDSTEQSKESLDLPFAVQVTSLEFQLEQPDAINIALTGIQVRRSKRVICSSIQFTKTGHQEIACMVEGLSVTKKNASYEMQIDSVESLRISGHLNLRTPLKNSKLTYQNGDQQLSIVIPFVHAELLMSENQPAGTPSDVPPLDVSSLGLSQIHLQIQGARIETPTLHKEGRPEFLIKDFDVTVSSLRDDRLGIELHKAVTARLQGTNKEWIQARLDATSAILSTTLDLDELTSSGMKFGPTSFGKVVVNFPSVRLSPGSTELQIEAPLQVTCESWTVLEQLRVFFTRFVEVPKGALLASSEKSKESLGLPFAVQIPSLEFQLDQADPINIALTGIQVRRSKSVICNSVQFTKTGPQKIDCMVEGLSVTEMGASYELQIESVESLRISGLLNLRTPLKNSKLTYQNDDQQLSIVIPFVHAELPMSENQPAGTPSTVHPLDVSSLGLSQIHLQIQGSRIETPRLHTEGRPELLIKDFDVTVSPLRDDRLGIELHKAVTARLQGANKEWIQARLDATSAILSTTLDLEELTSSGMKFGPTSFGKVVVNIPSVRLSPGSTELQIEAPLQVTCESWTVLEQLRVFFTRFVEVYKGALLASSEKSKESLGLPFAVQIPSLEFQLDQADPINIALTGIQVRRSKSVICNSVQFTKTGPQEIDCMVEGLSVTEMGASYELQIESFESLRISGHLNLRTPLKNSKLTYQNDDQQLSIVIPFVHAELPMSENQPAGTPSDVPPLDVSSLGLSQIHLQIQGARIETPRLHKEGRPELLIKDFDVTVSPLWDDRLGIELHKAVTARLQGANKEWIQARLDATSAILSTTLDLEELSSLGMEVGPSSVGKVFLSVAAAKKAAGKSTPFVISSVNGAVECSKTMDSLVNLLQDVVPFVMGQNRSSSLLSNKGKTMALEVISAPFPLVIQEVRLNVSDPKAELFLNQIECDGPTVQCNSLVLEAAGNLTASCCGLIGVLGEAKSLDIEEISSCSIHDTMTLAEPLRGIQCIFADETLLASASSLVHVAVHEKKKDPMQQGRTSNLEVWLPFTIHLSIPELRIQRNGSNGVWVRMFPVDVIAVPVDELISLDASESMVVRIESLEEKWLEGRITGVAMVLPTTHEQALVRSFTCGSIHIGPASCGLVSVDIPSLSTIPNSNELVVSDSIAIQLESVDVANHLHVWLADSFDYGPGGSQIPVEGLNFSVNAPEILLSITEMNAHAQALNTFVSDRGIDIAEINARDDGGATFSAFSFHVSAPPELRATIERISNFQCPGCFALSRPVEGIGFLFAKGLLTVDVNSVAIRMLASDGKAGNQNFRIRIPVAVNLAVNEFVMTGIPKTNESTVILGIKIQLLPFSSGTASSTKVLVVLDEVKNNMAMIIGSRISSVLDTTRPDTFDAFRLEMDSVSVSAGFSSIDWSNMFSRKDGNEEESVLNLPYGEVGEISAMVAYNGKVLSSSSAVHIPEFRGGPETTTKTIAGHLTQAIFNRMPSFFSNAEVLGTNIGESASMTAGRSMMRRRLGGRALVGSVGGSVVGLVASDGIKGAIASGKKARGASSDDRYRFGDITKGSVRAIRESARSGAEKRSGTGDSSYEFGDFTIGASDSMGTYASENKSRLAGAGGSGVGMVVGGLVLGPVGMLAGAYLGGRAGTKVVGDDGDKNAEVGKDHPAIQNHAETDVDYLNNPLLGNDQESDNKLQCRDTTGQGYAVASNQGYASASLNQPAVSNEPDVFGLFTSFDDTAHHQTVNHLGNTSGTTSNQSSFQDLGRSSGSISDHNRNQQQYVPPSAPPAQYEVPGPQAKKEQQQQQQQQGIHAAHHPTQHSGQRHFRQEASQSYATQQSQQRAYPPHQASKQESYRFGDLTRSVVKKGKEASGRSENDSYKFGDFTRGLFRK